jgi:hypothetical protein
MSAAVILEIGSLPRTLSISKFVRQLVQKLVV